MIMVNVVALFKLIVLYIEWETTDKNSSGSKNGKTYTMEYHLYLYAPTINIATRPVDTRWFSRTTG